MLLLGIVLTARAWASTMILLLLCIRPATATRWVTYTNDDGQTVYLDDNRQPSLYTQQYGDCLGDSLIDITRFDAAYYKDNMTITFHLGGRTNIANESLMSALPFRGYL